MKIGGVGIPELLILFGPPLLFGYFTMRQGQKKGYSPVGFFCLGFFTGLIGLIISLCLSDKNMQANAQTSVQSYAQQPQPLQPAYQQDPQAGLVDVESATWVCPSCGAETPAGAFCRSCGTQKPQAL